MDRERLDDWCEKGILALVLGILVFGPLALGAVREWHLAVIELMTAGVLTLWVARLWLVRRPTLLWPPICWAVLAFVAYAVVRYLNADIEYVARRELIRIVIYLFLFLAILNHLHRQETMNIIGLTVVFLGVAIAIYACWQFATKTNRVWNLPGGYPGRGSGTFYYPNSLAAFLEILVPLALSFVMVGRLPHTLKILLGYSAVVMLAGIGVTLSRGGWLTMALTLAVFCAVMVAQRDYRVQGLVLAGALGIAVIVGVTKSPVVSGRVEEAFPGVRLDDMRLAVWNSALEMWRDHVWWGVGPAHFDYRYRQYRPAISQRQPDRVHNDYLNVLTDWGVAGAVLVAGVWVAFWWGVFKAWKAVRGEPEAFTRRQSNRFAWLIGGATGLLAIMLHSAFDFNLHVPAIAILVVTLMALVSSQLRFVTERYWFRAKPALRFVATALLLAGCFGMTWVAWRSARESYWLSKSVTAREYSEERLAALEKAHAVEPMNFETTYAIGEWYREHSFLNMGGDPDALARKAMTWYQLGMKLDPYDGYNWLRYGMCLDWIGTGEEGTKEDPAPYFQRADELDPNGYYMTANIGWHYAQTGDNAAAREWFQRSLRLEWVSNDIASSYLPIVERRLEQFANQHKPGG